MPLIKLYTQSTPFCLSKPKARYVYELFFFLSMLINLLEGILLFYLSTQSIRLPQIFKSEPNCSVLLTLCLNDSDEDVLSSLWHSWDKIIFASICNVIEGR